MKDIIGYEGLYRITEDGRVFSIGADKFLKQFLDHKGYLFVCLRKNGKPSTKLVHRLVASAYLPIEFGKPYVNHRDSGKLNNAVSNLEWCSARENMLHSYANGRKPNSGNAKLSPTSVIAIRQQYAEGKSAYRIAKELGMGTTTIDNIVKRRTWVSI